MEQLAGGRGTVSSSSALLYTFGMTLGKFLSSLGLSVPFNKYDKQKENPLEPTIKSDAN